MWLSTHYFSGFLQDWFHVFLYERKKNSVWYNFYHGTSVSITFYIFEHYQLWMMYSKGQRVFFPKTPQLCVWHTEVRSCYHFKLVSHFQLWFPIWGVLVNRLSSSSCSWPTRMVTGPTWWRTCLRLNGFPVTDWIWYTFVVVVVGRLSWRLRVPVMKFPAEPESMRAVTGKDTFKAVSWTTVVSGHILVTCGLMALTISRGGRMGQVAMACPEPLQYRHKPWDRRRCLSVRESRVLTTCMGSRTGSGGLMFSGRRRKGIGLVSTCWSSIQECIQLATLMDSWMNRSSPMVSSYAARCNRNRGSSPCRYVVKSGLSSHPLAAARVRNFKA